MRFTDAKRIAKEKGITGKEHKMQPGAREGQKTTPPVTPSAPAKTVRPEVKELATELNVDLATVTGTGKDGNITMTDVRRAAQARDELEQEKGSNENDQGEQTGNPDQD